MVKNKNQLGFTVVELMVSIAIMGVLATLVMLNFRGGETERLLTQEAQRLTTEIREVQNMALTGQKIDGLIPEAYGVYIPAPILPDDLQIMYVYADFNANAVFDFGEEIKTVKINEQLYFFQNEVNFLFLPFKTIDGFCWTDYTMCSGSLIDQKLTEIRAFNDPAMKRNIWYDREVGRINVYE